MVAAADRTHADIAIRTRQAFRRKYQPLLTRRRDEARYRDDSDLLAGMSSANAALVLRDADVGLNQARSVGAASERASGLSAEALRARRNALSIRRREATGVLGAARGQQYNALSGIGAASRLRTSGQLVEAAAKARERQAGVSAGVSLATSLYGMGRRNIASGGTFWRPGQADPNRPGEIYPAPLWPPVGLGGG